MAPQPTQIIATTKANPTPISDNLETQPIDKPSSSKQNMLSVDEFTTPQKTTKGKEIVVLTDADTNESADDILKR
jgi:hypothetical protein